jgi:tetratricopeptide (TPR) repeat protein
MSREPTSQIVDILTKKVEQAKSGNYFELLDLPEDADSKQVKDAYFRLARLVHPDSVQKEALQDRKEDAAYIFEHVTKAYQVLSDAQKREDYVLALKENRPPSPEEQSKIAGEQAKISLHQGRMLLNRRQYAEAEEHFMLLTQLKPDEPRGYLYLGWSLFQNQQRKLEDRLEEARTAFEEVLKLDKENADAHYYMGLYHKEKGNMEEVHRSIKKALKFNPSHVPSLREQRLLEMRESKGPKQQSIGDYMKTLWAQLTKKKGE